MFGLDELNQEQLQAVEASDGPVLIVAGPGTGKTKTLTARIANLIATKRAKPEQILALTFTKKAAEEMRIRVAAMLAGGPSPKIVTFHALCHEILNSDERFATESERLQIIKQLHKSIVYKGISSRELGLLISRAKNMAEDDAALQQIVQTYNLGLQELGLMDFDDLLVRTRGLLQQDAVARTALQSRFTHILVDEFQDTNRLQYELLQLLRGTDNLFVIGDPLQSIYGFRGASGDIFGQFREDFPKVLDITLTTNYRSATKVVALSNRLFVDAPDLQPHATNEGQVRVVQVLNEYSEAAWVLAEIQQAIGGGDMLQAVSDDDASTHHSLQDFAILYRSRSAAIVMQKAIQDSGLPYQIVGEGSPYEQPKVQAIIALLRSAHSGESARIEGFTKGQAKAVYDLLGQTDGVLPHVLAEKAIRLLDFEITSGLQHFIGTLVRFTDLESAVGYFDRIAEAHFYDPSADAITLLTIHASKGLEFSRVFLIGVEEGILPYRSKGGLTVSEDEEKRLFYVAITRAKEHLDILHTKRRSGQSTTPSRFIAAVPEAVAPREVDSNLVDDQRRAIKRAAKRSQRSLF
ncbi:MAG TPA: ATP-dependent helicase [Patescibacteria group bacterium]|nr:ATP-dependent helicase [Patescibacteria group bacterium]